MNIDNIETNKNTNLQIKKIIKKYPDLYATRKQKKEKILLEEGDVANNVYFILSGIIKISIYNPDKLKYTTIFFLSENELLFPFKSFLKNKPARVFIEIIKDVEMYVVSKQN
jgi:CRP-like cAMP-binding protein